MLQAHAIHARHIDAVGNGVRALNRLPSLILRRAELGLLGRMPANRRRIKQRLRALQCRQPRRLRIPLIPANQRAHAPKGRIHRLKSQVPGAK